MLIFDGLTKYISEYKVGIPLGRETGKMIMTSRSLDVCRKSGCQNNMIAIDPLPLDEALKLFETELQREFLHETPMKIVAMKIVEQCRGVPLKIVDKARDLIGEDDIKVWEKHLKDMLVDDA